MTKFKYVGNVKGKVGAYGAHFNPGRFADVKGEHLIRKARNNPEFEEYTAPGTDDPMDEDPVEEVVEPEVEETEPAEVPKETPAKKGKK